MKEENSVDEYFYSDKIESNFIKFLSIFKSNKEYKSVIFTDSNNCFKIVGKRGISILFNLEIKLIIFSEQTATFTNFKLRYKSDILHKILIELKDELILYREKQLLDYFPNVYKAFDLERDFKFDALNI